MLTVYVEDSNGRRIGVIACGEAVFSTGNTGFRGNGKVVVDGIKYQASVVVSKVVKGSDNESAERAAMAERAKLLAEARAEAEKAEAQKAKTTEAQKAALAAARKVK